MPQTGKWASAMYFVKGSHFDCNLCGCKQLPCFIFLENAWNQDASLPPSTLADILASPGMIQLRICEHCAPNIAEKLNGGELRASMVLMSDTLEGMLQDAVPTVKAEIDAMQLLPVGRWNEKSEQHAASDNRPATYVPKSLEQLLRAITSSGEGEAHSE